MKKLITISALILIVIITHCQGPVANAGPDQKVDRRYPVALLDGSGTTGVVTTWHWRRITSVPLETQGHLLDTATIRAGVTILTYRGNNSPYQYELTASNTVGSSKDTVNVQVFFGTFPPQMAAGGGLRLANAADVIAIPNANLGDLIIPGANDEADSGGLNTSIYINTPAILTTTPLGPGKKILINSGDYKKINILLGAGQVLGTSSNKVVITNYGGQVKTQLFNWQNCPQCKLTGRYSLANKTGDQNYRGHALTYAYSKGSYGIEINNNWQSLDNRGIAFIANMDSSEVEFIELGNGGFAAFDVNYTTGNVDSLNVHDCYIHDAHSENMYAFSTGSDPTSGAKNIWIHNNRFIRSGSEGVQFGQQWSGNVVENNALVFNSTNWRTCFEASQNKAFQLLWRGERNRFQNNLVLGSGEELPLILMFDTTASPTTGDSNHLKNNLMKWAKGFEGGYIAKYRWGANDLKLNISDNWMGGFEFEGGEVYGSSGPNAVKSVNTQNVIQFSNNSNKLVFKNNKRDNTKTTYILCNPCGTLDTSGTTVRNIPNPLFENSGWSDTIHYQRYERWGRRIYATYGDEYGLTQTNKAGQNIVFDSLDIVFWYGYHYQSKHSNNTGNMPMRVTDSHWTLLSWTMPGDQVSYFPPDDFRLRSGDPYRALGMGLIDTVVGAPANIPPVANAGSDITITLPVMSVTLNGTGSLDPDGDLTAYVWTKISGPSTFNILTPTTPTSIVNTLTTSGAYVFQLQVTDNNGAQSTDNVTVTVNDEPADNFPHPTIRRFRIIIKRN